MTRAIIVVDVQNDFASAAGALYVQDGFIAAQRICELLTEDAKRPSNNEPSYYNYIATSRDWHPHTSDFLHFSDAPNYEDTWPVHCQSHTWGAQYHPNLFDGNYNDAGMVARSLPWHFDHQFFKGQASAAYSAFEGVNDVGTSFKKALEHYGVKQLDVCGIATDFCVKATAEDANKYGFDTRVLLDYCVGINSDAAVAEMESVGIDIYRGNPLKENASV